MSAIRPIPDLLLWLVLLLFVVHDLEETLLFKPWLRRNREWFGHRFPALARRMIPHFESVSTQRFAVMAAEEFLLLVAAVVYALISGNYYPWLAFFLAFTIHLIVHLAQWLVVRRYIPVVATTLLCLPFCVWGVFYIENSRLFSGREFAFCALAGCVAAVLNLWLIHKLTACKEKKATFSSVVCRGFSGRRA